MKNKSGSIFTILLCLFIFSSCENSLDSLDTDIGKNRIVLDAADPYIFIAEDGKYYFYATKSPGVTHLEIKGFEGFVSDDLITWKPLGMVYDGTDTWSDIWYWGPEVRYHNGKYYMVYSARQKKGTKKSMKIGLAISDSPKGPFIDILKDKPYIDPGFAVIDGTFLFDDDGKIYLYFSKDSSENIQDSGIGESHVYVIELNEDLSFKQAITPDMTEEEFELAATFLIKPEQDWEMKPVGNKMWNEAPFVIKRNDKYIMTYSANFFASSDYGLGIAISDNPMGPFTKKGNNPFLKSDYKIDGYIGPGSSTTFEDKNGDLFIVFHAQKFLGSYGARDAYLERLEIDGSFNHRVYSFKR